MHPPTKSWRKVSEHIQIKIATGNQKPHLTEKAPETPCMGCKKQGSTEPGESPHFPLEPSMLPASLFRDNASDSHDSASADALRQRGLVLRGLKDLGGAGMRTRETKKQMSQF